MSARLDELCINTIRFLAVDMVQRANSGHPGLAIGEAQLGARYNRPGHTLIDHHTYALGEDGPTHRPIEQLANLRSIPNTSVLRSADANEVAVAWQIALETQNRPVLLVLSRQAVPTLNRKRYASAEGVRRGAYVLAGTDNRELQLILIASGAEVGLIVAAAERPQAEGIGVRCVSMPSWDIFDALPQSEHDAVLTPFSREGAAALMNSCCGPRVSSRTAHRQLTDGRSMLRPYASAGARGP